MGVNQVAPNNAWQLWNTDSYYALVDSNNVNLPNSPVTCVTRNTNCDVSVMSSLTLSAEGVADDNQHLEWTIEQSSVLYNMNLYDFGI